MGWCALIPTMCHPRKEIPFCSVKSPRRNTKYVDLENPSNLASVEQIHRSFDVEDPPSNSIIHQAESLDTDYLHPKYSLPFIEISVAQQREYFEKFLRIPAHMPTKKLFSHSKRTGVVEKKPPSKIVNV
uniref:Protein aurora borealis n=1 Tax=Syphacia muris TaxID=451379 RepID=A0A0N5AZX0_9BILA